MGRLEEIREAMRRHAERFGPQPTILGIVTEIDPEDPVCTIVDDDDDFEYPQIRLRPVIDGKESLTMFPKIGTWALAVRIENDDDWMLIAAGEFDKWRLSIGETVIEQTAEGLRISNGDDTLKQVLSLIIDSIKPIMVLFGNNPDFIKLFQAETKLNNLLR